MPIMTTMAAFFRKGKAKALNGGERKADFRRNGEKKGRPARAENHTELNTGRECSKREKQGRRRKQKSRDN